MKDSARNTWLVACCFAIASLTAPIAGAQDVEDFEDWQAAEMRSLVNYVTAARNGQQAADEGTIELLASFMKGADGNTYVPFTLLVDESVIENDNVVTYVAVTDAGETPPTEEDEAGLPEALFENAFYLEADEDDGIVQIDRALQVPGGEYTVYIAIRDSEDGDAEVERVLNPRTRAVETVAIAPRVTLLRQHLTVPDLWNDELQTSSIILTEEVQPLSEPPSPDELAEFPYTIGTTRVVPKLDGNYENDDILGFVFMIYNTGHDDGMPDVSVGYDFYTVNDDGDEFFNRTDPQVMNNQTLPPGFDVTQGFQLVTGQNIPLGGFPAASYRLEIKVTDSEGDSEVTQNLLFSVED